MSVTDSAFISRLHNHFLDAIRTTDVNLFRAHGRSSSGSVQEGNPEEVVSRLDAALTSIFSEDGKKTVMYYVTNRFGLTLEQATVDPSRLERALTEMLGEIGWMVVKKAILEEFWGRKINLNETSVVERASLRDAFGFVHNLAQGPFFVP